MINIEKLRMEIRAWKKEKVMDICKEYDIPIDEELKQKTKSEISKIILDRAKDLNRIEEEESLNSQQLEQQLEVQNKEHTEVEKNHIIEETPMEQNQNVKKEEQLIGKEFIRVDDKSISPNIFLCISKGKDKHTFKFDGGKIEISDEDIAEMLIPYDKNTRKKKEYTNNNTLIIQVPNTNEISQEKQKTETVKVKLDKNNKSKKNETKSKNKEPLTGAGRGRITAKILCFDSPDRKTPIKEFSTFADAREFLNVKSVGDSLERASSTGKPSRGYWWIVDDIVKPTKSKDKNSKEKEDVEIKVIKQDEDVPKEEIIITPPVLEKKTKTEDEIDELDFFKDIPIAE